MHLTLRFLGEVDEAARLRADRLWSVAAAASARFDLRTAEIGSFPAREPARVLWLGVSDAPRGALAGLAGAVERAASEAGFAPERRPFRPHVTLARARRGASSPERPWSGETATMRVEQLSLMRSDLSPSGARYRVVARYPLEARPS